jgi:hypothetical protein
MSTQNQNSDNRLTPWLLALCVALAGSTGYLWFSKGKVEQKVAVQTVQITDMTSAKDSLQKTFDAALVELEGMKGKNLELNTMIDKYKEDIKSQKGRIDGMLKDKGNLDVARKQITELKSTIDGYLAQVAELQKKNETLTASVQTLSTEKTALTENVTRITAEKQTVETEKAAIAAEKAKIEEEKRNLASKVDIASVVRVNTFDEPVGFKVSDKGKETKKRWAENMQRVKWCFNANENPLAKPSKETFYVRVIDPTGVAIAVQSAGGGVTKLSDGKEVQYTFTKEADYDGTAQKICVQWDPGVALQKGAYQIEVYNKGYLAGKSAFTFKK